MPFFDCSFINCILYIILLQRFFCKEVVLFTWSSVAVISSVPIIFFRFYSTQSVSVYGPKIFRYFWISQASISDLLLNSVYCWKQLLTTSTIYHSFHYRVPKCHYHGRMCSEMHCLLNFSVTSFKYAYIQHSWNAELGGPCWFVAEARAKHHVWFQKWHGWVSIISTVRGFWC